MGQYYAGANAHAGLWDPGPVDLNPPNGDGPSAALASDGTHEGGYADFGGGTEAGMWTGTGGFAPLNIPSSQSYNSAVTGISGGVEVGYGTTQALLWPNANAFPVDLNPIIATSSKALGVSHGQAVGSFIFMPTTSSIAQHAVVWTGQTRDSFVDLGASSSGNSQANATNGTQQVGYTNAVLGATGAIGFSPAVWTGARPGPEMLPLPKGCNRGEAFGIDQDGNIVGGAIPETSNSFGAALLWVPHRVPGDANFDGTVGFDDLEIVARNYGKSNPEFGWVDGDFLDEGRVGFDDLLMVARNYGAGTPTTSQLAQLDPAFRADVARAFAEVPEPSSSALILASVIALSMGRRRIVGRG